MLPRVLYEFLPYFYLLFGVSTGLVFDSSVIFVAATLMVAAGLSILFMRYSYRQSLQEMLANMNVMPVSQENYVSRRSNDRRQRFVSQFPLIDSGGELVTNERRENDRRMEMA